MQLSIVYKLSLSSVFLVLISTGIVGWVFHAKTTDILVDKALRHISFDAQEAGNRLKQVVNAHNQDVLFLANTPPFQGILRARTGHGVDKKDKTDYFQWLSRLAIIFESLLERKTQYHMIRFIDPEGQELLSVRREKSQIARVKEKQLQNKTHRPYVRETLKLSEGNVYLSDINLNREYGEVVIPYQEVFRIATPIYDERNDMLGGLVVITFEIGDELRDIQQRANKRGDGEIYITNDRGGYLLHPDKTKTYGFDLGKRYRIQEDLPLLAEYFLPGNLNKHLMLRSHTRHENKVVNFKKIAFDSSRPERFIAVVMTQQYSNIVSEQSEVLNDIVLWVLLLALVAAGIAVVFSIRLTRPIQLMTHAVDEYSQKGSTSKSLPVTYGGEVGVLARSFNTMIQQVEQSQAQLSDMNSNLELIVEARTEDLNTALVEAERANLAKSEFLSRMSHELRTPMNAILGFGQMLELDAEDLNKTQRDNVKEIIDAGHHLLDLINEVLDLAKIESGNMDITLSEVSVDKVMQQCITLIQPLAESRHIEITDHVSGKEHMIHVDEMRFKQVMVNLLSNAVKYNSENGRIILDCELTDKQRIRIRVTDSGEGIKEEDITKLFIPFERLDQVNNVEGAGIGLVITKHLVELMQGGIGIESTLGEGSTFWVEFALTNQSARGKGNG
jgi:signal transduction histidine kinase